ncbi:hypothetical protein R1CP_33520 [Rhodococcus opacus]|uniref:Uncharacterized protein n=1 Tax=Rhodococcus opacus TaxID=37919 RepID=A0A1B1KFD1_RHOOP|nr:hypothetical protein R1CP_33520 [Rhodococcus opacus]
MVNRFRFVADHSDTYQVNRLCELTRDRALVLLRLESRRTGQGRARRG